MKLKLRVLSKFPAQLNQGPGINIERDGAAYSFGLDYTQFIELSTGLDVANAVVAIYNKATQQWFTTSLGAILASSQNIVVKTTSGDVVVAAADGVIVVNKASGAATGVSFPLAANKIGECLVVDFKGDAGINPITITPTSPETIMGQPSWTIAANNGSVRLKPIPGIGYVL